MLTGGVNWPQVVQNVTQVRDLMQKLPQDTKAILESDSASNAQNKKQVQTFVIWSKDVSSPTVYQIEDNASKQKLTSGKWDSLVVELKNYIKQGRDRAAADFGKLSSPAKAKINDIYTKLDTDIKKVGSAMKLCPALGC